MEVILGMAILSLLLSVSISYYQDYSTDVRQKSAVNQLREIGDAITRWSLENNRTYPYADLRPLQDSYLQGVGDDPWNGAYVIEPRSGLVYSPGPNGIPENGQNDDIVHVYGVLFESTPLPPSNLTAALAGAGQVRLDWTPPGASVDGTPLTTADGTENWKFLVSRSRGTGGTTQPAENKIYPPIVWGTTTFTDNIGTVEGTSFYYVVQISHRTSEQGTIYSAYSNQAGIFIPTSLPPRIVRFRPSAYRSSVGDPFHLDIEVVDPAGGLKTVQVKFDGQTKNLFNPIASDSSFFATKYSPKNVPDAPKVISGGIELTVVGGSAGDVTTSEELPLPVEFVNTPPTITSLRPGVTNFTVSPGAKGTIKFTVEARDRDQNLTGMSVKDSVGHEASFPVTSAYAAETSFAVERFSWEYDLSETSVVNIQATAKDGQGLDSPEKFAVVAISADVTPPVTPKVDLIASNTLISTDCNVFKWWLRSTEEIKGHWESFDPETEPVVYQAILTTAAITDLESQKSEALTWDQGTPGFTSRITTTEFSLVYTGSSSGHLSERLQENIDYHLRVRAINNAGLINDELSSPFSPICKFQQYPFGVDVTPPVVRELLLDNPGGTGWISQGPLVARWRADDLNAAGKIGSGPYIYSYRVYEYLTTMPVYDIDTSPGRLLLSGETRGTELRVPLDLDFPVHQRARYTVSLKVRDVSGNWSLTTSSSFVDVDLTAPGVVDPPAQIVTADGVITDPNSVDVTWAGATPNDFRSHGSIFRDEESGIRSFSWGIATSATLLQPDLYPGGGIFQFEASPAIVSRGARSGLFQDGDTVFLMVKALNYAGLESIISQSNPTFVDTDLEPVLSGSPVLGYAPMTVTFDGTVTGGGPCYRFVFQPRSNPDPSNPENIEQGPVAQASLSQQVRTYDLTDLGTRTARLIVESMAEQVAGICDVTPLQARQTELVLLIRPQPYLAVLTRNALGANVILMDVQEDFAILDQVQMPGSPGEEEPVAIQIDPSPDKRFAIVAVNNPTREQSHLYRVETGEGLSVTQNVSLSGLFIENIDLADDGRLLVGTARTTETAPRLFRVRLSGGVMETPEVVEGRVMPVGPGRITVFRNSTLSFSSRGSTKLEKSGDLTASGAPQFTTLDVPLNVSALQFSPDGRTVALGPVDSGDNEVGFLDPVSGSVQKLPLTSNGTEIAVRDIVYNATGTRAYFLKPGEVVEYEVATGRKVEGSDSGNALVGTGFVAGSLSFEGSYLVAADTANNQIAVLHTREDDRTPLDASIGGLTFGAPILTVDLPALEVPVDLELYDRPNFGTPVVLSVSPASASPTTVLTIRGHNLAPSGSLVVLIGSTEVTPVIPVDHNIVSVTVPSGVASGQQQVRVRNDAYANPERNTSVEAVFVTVP